MVPSISAPVTKFGRAALDLLLPPYCPLCDNPVSAPELLCASCFAGTSFISDPKCDRCGVAFESGESRLCEACSDRPPNYRQARGALSYDAGGRHLVLPLKHGDRTELAKVLAPMVARAGSALLARADVMVPVPLHRRRLFRRRYNQAVLLAAEVSRLTEVPVMRDALIRTKPTAPMGDKPAEERKQAVQNVFAMRAGRSVAGKQVLLIDDVMTSGATVEACTEVLTAAGAAAVDVLVAARVALD